MNLTIPQQLSLKGHYKFTRLTLETDEHRRIDDAMSVMQEFGLDATPLREYLESVCKKEVFEYENVVTTAYKTALANNSTDPTPTNSILFATAALGTGTNAPVAGDTALQTQVYSNNLASKSNTANVAYATAYFNATETSGTYREAGIKTADLLLVSRVAINITKTTSQTLTLDWSLTIS